MERIIIVRREKKTEGLINLRLRLRDGRGVDLFHKTDIKVDLKDLAKFNEDGTIKTKVTIYNKKFKQALDKEINAMRQAYYNLCEKMDKTHISGELFEKEIFNILKPEEPTETEAKKESLLHRFERFIEEGLRDNLFGLVRKRNYLLVKNTLERYLTIKHLKRISPDEFTAEMLMDFQSFIGNEYLYVEKYPKIYGALNEKQKPKAQLESNTVAMRIKMIQALYNELLDKEELELSPFYKLGRKRRAAMVKEEYEDPKFLRKEEFLTILNTEVPQSLKQVKAAFLLQCNFGCRISDFSKLTMDKVSISEGGIPYIHYLPQKTMRSNTKRIEIETPILRYALDIIKEYQFNFPILKYATGERGYNAKIKDLLKYCGIDRQVKTFDSEQQDNVYLPLYEFGSSKLCRSTHVDMMSKIQIDQYVSGLHRKGSEAVKHYTKNELGDRFALMCAAFDQPLYKVDKDLNLIGE